MDIARKPACRLEFVFAAKAPLAVILRRGPSRSVRMVLWHTRHDRFVDGEWWRGRIYAEKCGLSPDGKHFVYFGYQWKPKYIPEDVFAFSAVSRPPSFRPVALWPADSFWGGGGHFPDNRTLCLNYGEGFSPAAHPAFPPRGIQVQTGVAPHRSSPAGAPSRSANPADTPGADWSGQDHVGQRVFARAGALYRLLGGREILLRDFNGDTPPWTQS